MVSRVQTGSTTAAGHELIELQNISSYDINVINWCITYASANSMTTGNTLHCLSYGDQTLSLFLPTKRVSGLSAESWFLSLLTAYRNGELKLKMDA